MPNEIKFEKADSSDDFGKQQDFEEGKNISIGDFI